MINAARQNHPRTAHVVMTSSEDALLKSIVDLSPYKRSELLRKCFFENYRNEKGIIYAEDLLELFFVRSNIEKSKEFFKEDPWLTASRKKEIVSLSDSILDLSGEKYRELEGLRTRIKSSAVKLLLKQQTAFSSASRIQKQTCQAAISVTEEEHSAIKKAAAVEGKTISKVLLDPVFSGCVGRIILVDSFVMDLTAAREQSEAVLRISSEKTAARNFKFAVSCLNGILSGIESLKFPSDSKIIRSESEKFLQMI